MIGETLGTYRIISEIGSGGMGVVYLAEHTLLGRKAAVKVLRADMPAEYVERFFVEAKAAASLDHPGLVDVIDFGHHTDGSAFIVMEYLAGESLAERLEHDPRLPVAIACTITRAVALALQVAHDGGIVHRDLKPGNIFLIPDPEAPAGVRPKVLDFGIAKLIRDREPRSVKTQSGAVIGTPRYMSPEQCKNARDVDGRSDIYSLGCILYEMLLGVAPFDYDSWAELVGAHIYEEPPRPTEIDPKLPADVETLVTKMLEKSPGDRFESMQALAQSLEVLLRTHGGERMRLTPGPITATPARGVKQFDSGQDPTLPAASGQLDALRVKRAASEPTLASPGHVTAPARKVPWVSIGLGAVAVAAIAVVVTLVLADDRVPPSETAYIVVDQRGSADSARKPIETDPTDDAEVGDAAVDIADAATPATPGSASRRDGTTKPAATKPDLVQLERTFARKSGAMTRCFLEHGEPTEKLEVRFQVDTGGTVRAADVLPASVSPTPLGRCVVAIARATAFGPQPERVTFRVPLLTRNR